MFVRESVAFERRREDCPAIAEVAAGFVRGVTEMERVVEVSVTVEITFVGMVVVVIVVMLVGWMVTSEVTVVEPGGGKGSVTVKSVGVGGGVDVDVSTPVGAGLGIGIDIGNCVVVGRTGGGGGMIDGKAGHSTPHPGGKKLLNDIQEPSFVVSFLRSVLLSIPPTRSSQPVETEAKL